MVALVIGWFLMVALTVLMYRNHRLSNDNRLLRMQLRKAGYIPCTDPEHSPDYVYEEPPYLQ